MKKVEFMSTASRPITIFLDKITAVSKFDTTSSIVYSIDNSSGPKPSNFVEVELDDGKSINAGEWIRRGKYWILRITSLPKEDAIRKIEEVEKEKEKEKREG